MYLFSDDMILYIESPTDSSNKWLELINTELNINSRIQKLTQKLSISVQ